ncbi:hypothetical protein [Armatimonas sp.]|uniref:hypothetical protein n=1 Tax=Armatimonas sp. TaxID=1872638 RepID=UPI00374FE985
MSRKTPGLHFPTGITFYIENGGSINEAQKLANHADPRTTKLYDRSGDTVSLNEIDC